MSNLVVNGILFYHGGTADLGKDKEVAKNFGPVNACTVGIDPDQGLNHIRTEHAGLNRATQELATLAKDLGANAIIGYHYSPTFLVRGNPTQLQCVISAYGDAVLIKPKGAS